MTSLSFPNSDDFRPVTWSPLLLRPLIDSPEQFVIAVACVGEDEFYLAVARNLDKFECLFGVEAGHVLELCSISINSAGKQLIKKRHQLFSHFEHPVYGVSLGESRVDAGRSAREVAEFWLKATSSLEMEREDQHALQLAAASVAGPAFRNLDREAVVKSVVALNPLLLNNFRPRFRSGGRPGVASEVDYASERLIANIDSISPRFRVSTVDRLVKRMWDLEIARGHFGINDERYELLVQVPDRDRDDISQSDYNRVQDTVGQLEKQADQQRIRFRPFTDEYQIGASILKSEGVQAASHQRSLN